MSAFGDNTHRQAILDSLRFAQEDRNLTNQQLVAETLIVLAYLMETEE